MRPDNVLVYIPACVANVYRQQIVTCNSQLLQLSTFDSQFTTRILARWRRMIP